MEITRGVNSNTRSSTTALATGHRLTCHADLFTSVLDIILSPLLYDAPTNTPNPPCAALIVSYDCSCFILLLCSLIISFRNINKGRNKWVSLNNWPVALIHFLDFRTACRFSLNVPFLSKCAPRLFYRIIINNVGNKRDWLVNWPVALIHLFDFSTLSIFMQLIFVTVLYSTVLYTV